LFKGSAGEKKSLTRDNNDFDDDIRNVSRAKCFWHHHITVATKKYD
jgi:hypothetical protein